MKGYSEHRGCTTQLVFDAATGQFEERIVAHPFDAKPQKQADVIMLASRKKLTPRRSKGEAHWMVKKMM